MKRNFARHIALLLAILVFVATTGINVYAIACQHTGKTNASLLGWADMDCCKKEVVKTSTSTCCSKKMAAECSHLEHEKSGIKKSKCCHKKLFYDSLEEQCPSVPVISLPNFDISLAPRSTMFAGFRCPNSSVALVSIAYLRTFPAHAPPRKYGRNLLLFVQNFRC